MTWGKLHDDILADPKLMRAGRKGAMHLFVLPWLIAFAIKAADHGRLSVGEDPAEPEDIADQIPCVTAMQVAGALSELEAIGVLSEDPDGCPRFTKWEDRQAKPSSTKTAVLERVHKHRAKVKRAASKERNTTPALQGVTGSDEGGVSTPGDGAVTPRNATEKRREEKKEKNTGAVAPRTRPTWVTDGVALWTTLVGTIPLEQFGAALKPIVHLHGWPAVRPDLEKWARGRIARGQACNPTWYAKEASARLAPKPPLVDEHGQLTEYGERMSRPGAIPA
jgi:hypothetical protein